MIMEKVTAGRQALGDFAPKFAELNDDILFGEVWSREDKLVPRDRSIITVTALVSNGIFDSSLSFHMQKAKENGVTKTEIAEILTQIAFYSGWPKAWAAFNIAKTIWTEEGEITSVEDFSKKSMFPIGEANEEFSEFFIGKSYLYPVITQGVNIFNVTFEPSCRNNWHIHKAKSGGGQILLCVAGKGLYQEAGKAVQCLKSGDSIYIAPGVKHWHGAAADSYFSHLAIEIPGEETENEWLEPVDDSQYPQN